MRKLFVVYAISCLLSPISVWGLGMGELRVNSHLNQPLKAEIELHSVSRKDLDQLRVQLASKKLFSRSHIEYSHDLSELDFKLTKRKGKNIIAITTKKPFRAPFVNFLLETRWGSGQLFREYTILLDPPEFIAKHARPASTQLASSSKQKNNKQLNKKISANKFNAASYSGLSSGKIKRNDTLWNVAKRMAPAGVSVDQMMMALLRDNPNAFFDNNINNLKSGYVLRIKDPSMLTKISRSMAKKQVKEQYLSWKETRKQSKVTNIVNRDKIRPSKVKNDGKLSLVASGDTYKPGTNMDSGSKARTKKEKLAVINENLNSRRLENKELKQRIDELEKLIETQDSLIVLKDRSLAILQQQYKSKKKNKNKLESDRVVSDNEVQRTDPDTIYTEINSISPVVTQSGQ